MDLVEKQGLIAADHFNKTLREGLLGRTFHPLIFCINRHIFFSGGGGNEGTRCSYYFVNNTVLNNALTVDNRTLFSWLNFKFFFIFFYNFFILALKIAKYNFYIGMYIIGRLLLGGGCGVLEEEVTPALILQKYIHIFSVRFTQGWAERGIDITSRLADHVINRYVM